MITAECQLCGRRIPCESSWVANYVMLYRVPCTSMGFDKCQEDD